MSLTAAHLDALVGAGATAEQIVALVKADMLELEKKAADRRDKDAERQRRERSRGVTRTRRDTPPIEDNHTPPVIPTKPIGLEPKPKKHRLPANWEPKAFSVGTMAAQIVARWEPGRMERELAKFRDHHTAAGSRFEDWQAAWSKWVNNSEDFGGRHGSGSTPGIGKSAAAFATFQFREGETF